MIAVRPIGGRCPGLLPCKLGWYWQDQPRKETLDGPSKKEFGRTDYPLDRNYRPLPGWNLGFFQFRMGKLFEGK